MKKLKVGIIGCGNISGIYIQNLLKLPHVELAGAADREDGRAAAKVEEMRAKVEGVMPRVMTVKELLGSEVELVVNLTVPQAHAEVAVACLEAGKHEYHEKPFGLNREEGRRILEAAAKRGLRVGCAPDTFLGAGIQTARQVIDEGTIGEIVGCCAFMTCPGHEWWHPDPEFYYQVGGGPLMDMGPYYLTALVNLIGPVKRVGGMARVTRGERTITSEKKKGTVMKVETPTHIVSSLEFAGGGLGTMVMSFDVYGANLPRIEVWGTKGSVSVPDPNTFGGEVKVKVGRGEWTVVRRAIVLGSIWGGVGVSDMARGILEGGAHRASGELGFHVLDVMQSCLEAAGSGRVVEVESRVERPAAFG